MKENRTGWMIGALLLAPCSSGATGPAHDLYVCASLEPAFYIGSRTGGDSGILRSPDRIAIGHVGFNHPRIDALAADPRNPAVFYAAASNGLLRTLDYGRTWRIMTGWDMTELKAVAIDPQAPDSLYVALPDGVGVSRDGGNTWVRGQAGIRRGYTQSLAADRSRSGRLVAGTELGFYVSEDGAHTWTMVQATDATVNDVRQSPHDPLDFLGVTQSNGAWRSADGGRTWRQVAGVGTACTLHFCDFDATDPHRLVLCGWGCGVLVSEDGGVTWHARNTGLPNANVLCVGSDPDRPGRLYAAPHESAIYVSDDFGRTWRKGWFERATVRRFVFVPRPAAAGAIR
jgi:photosystem II stability/assembly factor-like uncharacterized protein